MISIDSSLCTGCGTCVDACPKWAISLTDGQVAIDVKLCDDCGRCVQVCPDQALSLVREPEMAISPVATARTVVHPATDRIDGVVVQPSHWHSTVRPAVGAFLGWAGQELAPRLVPLALDALEAVLDRRLSRRTRGPRVRSTTLNFGDFGQRRRHRHRFGRTRE